MRRAATLATALLVATLVVPRLNAASAVADAVVLVNSRSARYLDFKHLVQPYLENFGIPYTVQDIVTNPPGASLTQYAVIIIGHSQLDTNLTYLSEAAQAEISLAVWNGSGLVNFDNDLSAGGSPRYQFVQDIFGFSYKTGANGASATLPATEPASQMHFITARHPANDIVPFRSGLGVPGLTLPTSATALVWVAGQPLLTIARYGQGRAVQWGSYGWMISTVLGPADGLDDVVWRSVVWTARKPFVMRGLPNFVTMRVDDVDGPLEWVHAANAMGFKPFLSLMMSNISAATAADLRGLVANGNATASIHSFTDTAFFYFNHQLGVSNPDTVQSNYFYLGTQWHTTHGIPISKVCASHYSELGPNCFAGLKAWGIEYVPIEVVPGTLEYSNNAPWVVNGPYRLYETPQPGQVGWPTYYADWLNVPGHPEFDGQFFNVYSEVRDMSGCGEWCPDNDVAGSINRATAMLKRSLDSMVMATVFSHEWYIHPTHCCGSTTITSNNWRLILQGITNNLAAYQPNYVTLDHASQYVRATKTSRLMSSAVASDSGQVSVTFSGQTDLDTGVYVFDGVDTNIASSFVNVPAFGPSSNVTMILSDPPMIIHNPAGHTNSAGTDATFSVGTGGAWPLSYQWYRNGTNALADDGHITGADSATLTIHDVLGGDLGSYSVVITNAAGNATSASPAILVVIDPAILTQPADESVIAGAAASFTVAGAGSALTYQWLKNGVPIDGATNPALNLTNTSTDDAGSYSVRLTGTYGSLLSSNALLTVYYTPEAQDDSYTATAESPLTIPAPGVLGNDTVQGGGNTMATLVNAPIHGTLSLNSNGGFAYYPLTNHVGADSFSYQAVNGPTHSSIATVSVATIQDGVLFADGFARLTDPGPLSPWETHAGNWEVTGGLLRGETNTLQSYSDIYLTGAWTNYSVEAGVRFSTTNSSGGGIGGRVNPASGAKYALWLFPESSPGGSAALQLFKFRTWTSFGYLGTNDVPLQEVTLASVGTNWHRLKLAFLGNQIAAFYEGKQVMSVTDMEAVPLSGGGISMDFWTAAARYEMSVSDVMVRPLVVDDSYEGIMNHPLQVPAPGVLENDTGVAPTNLLAALVNGPSNGTLNLADDGHFTYTPATNYYGPDSFSYRATQGTSDLGTATVRIMVVPDVPIIEQAPGSRTNSAGSATVFSVAALGVSPLAYGWFQNGTNALEDGANISGTASAELTISNLLGGNAGSYSVVVSSSFGSVTSTPSALLTVIDPFIALQPVSQTNPAGAEAVLRVEAYGTALAYQWFKDGDLMTGETGATLNLSNLSQNESGTYCVAVHGTYGSVTSSNATLLVFYETPIAYDDRYSAEPDTDLVVPAPGVLGNDTVPGGAELAAELVGSPLHGAVHLHPGGSFTYRAFANYVGPDDFSYQAVNGPMSSGLATVTLVVAEDGVLFSDNFVRSTDPGPLSPWVAQSGDWQVTGGILQGVAEPVDGYGSAYFSNNWANYSVEGRLRFSAANAYGGGIGGRLDPVAGAHYGLWLQPEGSPAGSNVLRILKFQTWSGLGYNGFTGTPLQEVTVSPVGTNWHTLKLAFHGKQLGAFYEGKQVMSVTDTDAPAYLSGGIVADLYNPQDAYTMSLSNVITRPLAVDDRYTGTTNAALEVAAPGVLGNDTGVYATNLEAVLVSGPSHGVLAMNANGQFTYEPTPGFIGADSFTYQANQRTNNLGTATVTITIVSGVPVILHGPSSRTNDAGATSVFTVEANGVLPLTYQWYRNGTEALSDSPDVSGAQSATLTINRLLGADAGSYSVAVINQLGSVTSTPPAVLTVIDPVITSQPTNQLTGAGTDVTFRAGLSGTLPVSYQWYRDGTNALSDDDTISGSHRSRLVLRDVMGADAGSYSVVVMNALGVVTSAPPALLTVIDPIITNQPANQTNVAGTTARFSVGASGTSPSYQWLRGGVAIDGATTDTLILENVSTGDSASYSVLVSNMYGSLTSSQVQLAVLPALAITSLRVTNGFAVISCDSVAGQIYRLQYKDLLTDPIWQDALPDVLAIASTTAFTNAIGNAPQRFYRVALLPAEAVRPKITSITVTNGIAAIEWSSVLNQHYRLQFKASLSETTWTNLASDVVATGPITKVTLEVGNSALRFYRVAVLP